MVASWASSLRRRGRSPQRLGVIGIHVLEDPLLRLREGDPAGVPYSATESQSMAPKPPTK